PWSIGEGIPAPRRARRCRAGARGDRRPGRRGGPPAPGGPASARSSAGKARERSLDPEGEGALGAMAVAGHDPPENAITAGRERRQADLEQLAVGRIDARIALVDPAPVGVLDANRAEDGLDAAVEPDANGRRRRFYRVADPGLGVVGKRVSLGPAGYQQE